MKAVQQWYTFMIRKKSVTQPLGRWAIDTCDKKRNTKIDFSNEDHCGPCGNNSLLHIVKPIPEEKVPDKKNDKN
jgi:hypothetical protein